MHEADEFQSQVHDAKVEFLEDTKDELSLLAKIAAKGRALLRLPIKA